ncbi:MAG: phosphate regulon transcriptional regulator PhoB [Sphingomonadales bacterium]|nr:phosphate regulon transcriptional regulator PhoB [Sphingomonadales bacterium]
MNNLTTKVLIIEDDPDISELISMLLRSKSFEVSSCADGEAGLTMARNTPPDIIILDWMLPNLSGIEICRRLRRFEETKQTSIIMLTSRDTEEDMIRGLDTGADDYISKPFSPTELIARINAVLRRTKPSSAGEVLTFEDIELNSASHRVSRGENQIHLGPTEYKLLLHLMEHPKHVYSRDQLLDAVWGHDVYVESRTVDVHIRRLRKALNEGDKTNYIRTIRSAGYAIDYE